MENDVEIEELSRINQEKNERLQKMKMNIEKLQLGMNMSKKFRKDKPNTNNIAPEREPITILNHYQREYSSTSPINSDKEFNFNSNLFRGITNESQPILENGSAVSNFSSVSNINNLLNGRQANRSIGGQQQFKPLQTPYQRPKQEMGILSQIDSLLERSKKATNLPIKGFEKYLGIIQSRQSKHFSEIEEVESSRYSDKKIPEPVAKLKVQDFRKRIDKLDIVPQRKPLQPYKASKQVKNERSNSSNIYEQQQIEREKPKATHKRSELSNFSSNTQMVESYARLPPHPSGRPATSSLVDRHRALIQQTFQEKKKLETQVNNQNLDRTEFDLELSDEQSEQQRKENTAKVEALQREKRQLKEELERIQRELQELLGSD